MVPKLDSAVCTKEIPSLAFRWEIARPLICEVMRSVIASPAASSAALLIRSRYEAVRPSRLNPPEPHGIALHVHGQRIHVDDQARYAMPPTNSGPGRLAVLDLLGALRIHQHVNSSLGGGLGRLRLIRQATASLGHPARPAHRQTQRPHRQAGRQEFVAITEAFNFISASSNVCRACSPRPSSRSPCPQMTRWQDLRGLQSPALRRVPSLPPQSVLVIPFPSPKDQPGTGYGDRAHARLEADVDCPGSFIGSGHCAEKSQRRRVFRSAASARGPAPVG